MHGLMQRLAPLHSTQKLRDGQSSVALQGWVLQPLRPAQANLSSTVLKQVHVAGHRSWAPRPSRFSQLQAPFRHDPLAQPLPQRPQFLGSVSRSISWQAPPQQI